MTTGVRIALPLFCSQNEIIDSLDSLIEKTSVVSISSNVRLPLIAFGVLRILRATVLFDDAVKLIELQSSSPYP